MLNGMNVLLRSSCSNPGAVGPNRPCGSVVKTMAPALVEFLNPEPRTPNPEP
jgi:hypothetical protein